MLACFDSLTRPLNAEWYKKPLHVHDFAPSRMRILNPRKLCLRNPEFSGALESEKQLKESGIPLTIEIQNPTATDKDWNPVPGIRNPREWNPESKTLLHSLTWGKTDVHPPPSGPLSLLPTKRCQRPPMIHHPPRPLLLLISAVHLGLLLLHPQDMSILSSLPIDSPQTLTALL